MSEQRNLTQADKDLIQAYLEGYMSDTNAYDDDSTHIEWTHMIISELSEYLKASSFVPFPPEWKIDDAGTIY